MRPSKILAKIRAGKVACVCSTEDAKLVADLGAQFISFGSEFFGIHRHLETCSTQWNELFGKA